MTKNDLKEFSAAETVEKKHKLIEDKLMFPKKLEAEENYIFWHLFYFYFFTLKVVKRFQSGCHVVCTVCGVCVCMYLFAVIVWSVWWCLTRYAVMVELAL